MMDYFIVQLARSEYEERVRKAEMELMAKRRQLEEPGVMSRMLFRLGEWLESVGARLKAHYQPTSLRQPYHGGHAR